MNHPMRALLAALFLLLALPAAASGHPDKRPPKPSTPDGLSCIYTATPRIWEFPYPPLGGKVKICLATVNCYSAGKYYRDVTAPCPLTAGDCPTANDCGRWKPGWLARESKTRKQK